MSNPSSARPVSSPSQAVQPAPPVIESPQPTVRVMRLYKPNLYVSSIVPNITSLESAAPISSSDFAVSPYLLLPDSFGDIYIGETFSAYIAVVNGVQDKPFDQISLSARLQSANASHDLTDSFPSDAVTKLQPNNSIDMVVNFVISEVGSHTLRVSVQYQDQITAEIKTVRKFYRFNVLLPMEIKSNVIEGNSCYFVQYQVTNMLKVPITIEHADIETDQADFRVEFVCADTVNSLGNTLSKFLNIDESYAFSFIVYVNNNPAKSQASLLMNYKSIGVPKLSWCTCMGESGVFRGPDLLTTNTHAGISAATAAGTARPISTVVNNAPATVDGKLLQLRCLSCPDRVIVGHPFETKIRVVNTLPHAVNAVLINKATIGDKAVCLDHLCVLGLSTQFIGELKTNEFRDLTIQFMPLSCGLQECKELIVVDKFTGKEYGGTSVFKLKVDDCNNI